MNKASKIELSKQIDRGVISLNTIELKTIAVFLMSMRKSLKSINWLLLLSIVFAYLGLFIPTSNAQNTNADSQSLDIPQETIEDSPLLQRWLQEIPDISADIDSDPAFTTRVRLGYSLYPSNDDNSGIIVGVEDIFIDRTGLTFSADYQSDFDGDRTSVGGAFSYYVLPLGDYLNIAPVLGYRYLQTGNFNTNGVDLGIKLKLSLSRTGAADISLTQRFLAPTTDDEVGITTLSVGYAVTPYLRLATDLEKENSRVKKDSRVSILLEWIP
jgi:hypothetical protein